MVAWLERQAAEVSSNFVKVEFCKSLFLRTEGRSIIMYKRRGFTLVELLIVIAIIALLMSILMPALARVRNMAKVTACQSNLKQWGLFWSMYTGDNDGYFERGWEGDGFSTCFFEVLQPYYSMKEKGVNLCPRAAKPWSEGGVAGMPDAAWGAWGDPGLPAGLDFMTDPEALGDYSSYGAVAGFLIHCRPMLPIL